MGPTGSENARKIPACISFGVNHRYRLAIVGKLLFFVGMS